MVSFPLKINSKHLSNVFIQPPKKSKIDKELKKKNTEAAQNIVNMLRNEKSKVDSTVDVNPTGTEGSASDSAEKVTKRPSRKIDKVSTSKKSKESSTNAKTTTKNSVGNNISSAAKTFYYAIDCQRVADSVEVIDLVNITFMFKINIFYFIFF